MAGLRVDWKELQAFMAKIFEGLGMPPADAALEAEVLVWANLRGVDSHGVHRIAEYSGQVDRGLMNPRPEVRVERETPAVVLIEGDWAFGPVVTVFAVEKVVAKAREMGIGWALIRNTTHQGAMGYYTEMITRENMAGIASVCNRPNTAPTGAMGPGVHNSPISIAVPGADRRPINLDMATSVVAWGKLQVAIDKGEPIPEGWSLDKEGRPNTDPKKNAVLLPTGDYKGYGLSLMFECLSSLMVGTPLLSSFAAQDDSVKPGTQNSFIAAIDIGFFTDVEGYRENVDKLVKTMKDLPLAEGAEEVFVPGEKEDRMHEERAVEGIPLPPGTVEKLKVAAERFGLEMPAGIEK